MPTRFVLACIAALLMAACRKTEVTTYRIPKEKDPEMPGLAAAPTAPAADAGASTNSPPPSMANTAVATASGPELTWTAPPDWKAKSGSAMRKGTYAIPTGTGADVELSITAFGGTVGGELANVNRWRGQVQVPPIGEEELDRAVTRRERNGLQITIADTGDAAPQRILGAMVPFAGATWFFKVGPAPAADVGKVKDAFLGFIDTLKAGTPAPNAP